MAEPPAGRPARDTDRDWRIISEHDPYFGVLTNNRYLTANLTPEVVEEFYETGRADVARTVEILRAFDPDFAPEVAVDFGCGVGRLVFAMADHANRVIGVDVAEPMLEVARQRARDLGIQNTEWATTLPAGGGVDWINSLIVFQHIPPARGTVLFEELVQLLRPGGFVSVQVTFFRDQRHTGEVHRDLGDYRYDGEVVELLTMAPEVGVGGMSMYDYDLNRIFWILFTNGVGTVKVEHTDHGGCHGVMIYGRRAREATADDTVPAVGAPEGRVRRWLRR